VECKEVKRKKGPNTVFREKLKEKRESKHVTSADRLSLRLLLPCAGQQVSQQSCKP